VLNNVTSSQPDISIVIVSFNTRDLLDDCLTALTASVTTAQFEIIVIDNASHDGSMDMVRTKHPSVRVHVNADNVGFARANNQGALLATGRYLLLLNSDTEVASSAMEEMFSFLEHHPGVGIVGPQLRNTDGTLQPSGNSISTLATEILLQLPIRGWFGLADQDRFFDRRRDYSQIVEVDEVSGACLMVRRSIWDGLRGLDEAYFFYYEDVDFCVRARRMGWQVMYAPAAVVVHHGGASTGQIDAKWAARSISGYFYFMRRLHGRPGELLIRAVVAVVNALKVVVGGVMSLMGVNRFKTTVAIATALFLVSIGRVGFRSLPSREV
jgi:GT2 family glycosyltransferase